MARLSTDELKQLVMDSANGCGLDPFVALVQMDRESAHFAPSVVYGPSTGTSGEKGMAQFMPDTWKRFGSGQHNNAYDPVLAMQGYCNYMGYLMGLFGNYSDALTGYNGGEGHILDPGKFGAPSTAAKGYARDVIAQADAMRGSGQGENTGSISPPGASSGQIPTPLIVGGLGFGALMVWLLLSD